VNLQPLREAVAALPSLDFGDFQAASYFLYQSTLRPSGSVYTKLGGVSAGKAMIPILVLLAAYLLGAIPFGYVSSQMENRRRRAFGGEWQYRRY